ncbi:DUF5719 family protein [Bifidobacterium apri]|uniref:Organic solvents resistance ABC transporter permease n=1 Tax=Bifidobacterium apri TaxID=1769423 RepID=A0A6A2VEX6_9BIFI|nr:DUF5719 family protein [Bifidobacterium apri]KAB8297595.1 hypothetical protein DSM100238_1198 [Bifidobacterium apri]
MSQELSNRKRGGAGRHTASTVRRVLVAVLTMILIVAVFAALTVLEPARWLIDRSSVSSATTVQHVSQTQYGLLCPQQMTLADDENFGDSEYQATAGNITSAALYAAFGSVYGADVYNYPLSGEDAQSSELSDDNLLDSANVKTLAGDVTKNAQYIDAKLLEAKSGTGVIGSMASWATSGDLRGMSAASCVPTALTDAFLLPATQTGVTEQLVVSNPSQKSTSLDVTVYGTKHAGKLSLSTSSTLTVAAGGQATLDISAAAPGQQGVYVTVSSTETPIASVVNVTRMQGLKPLGSDVVLPLGDPALTQALPGVVKGDAVTALVYAERNTTVTLSWVTGEGRVEAKTVTVPGNRVTAVDLGNAPDDATGLFADATSQISVQATVSQSASGQADFAFIPGESGQRASGLVIPSSVSATLQLVNLSDTDQTVTLHGYDASGNATGSKRISVGATTGVSVDPADIGDNTQLFTCRAGKNIVWGARLSQASLSSGKVAQAAYLPASSLEPQSREVLTVNDQRIVH